MKIYNVEVIHKSKIEGAGRRSKEKLKNCACRLERERRANEREKFLFYPQVKPWGGHCNKIVVDVNALGI